jgi:transposase-like protein
MNNQSGQTSERDREAISRYETCFISFAHKGREMQNFRRRERHFICNVCKKLFTDRFNIEKSYQSTHWRKAVFLQSA